MRCKVCGGMLVCNGTKRPAEDVRLRYKTCRVCGSKVVTRSREEIVTVVRLRVPDLRG